MKGEPEVPGLLTRLAEAAEREEPADMDIAGRVLRTIADGRPRRAAPGEAVLLAMAAASSAAAAVAAVPAWQSLSDPMVSMLGALTWLMM